MPSGLCLPGSFWASRRRRKRTRPFLGPACRNWGASSQPGPGRSHPSPLSPDTHCYTQSPELRPGLGLQRFFHSNGIISLRLFKSLWSIYRGGLGGAAPWAPATRPKANSAARGTGGGGAGQRDGGPSFPLLGTSTERAAGRLPGPLRAGTLLFLLPHPRLQERTPQLCLRHLLLKTRLLPEALRT